MELQHKEQNNTSILKPKERQQDFLCGKEDSYHYFSGPSITFSEDTLNAFEQLGEILQGIHQDMLDEGYEFVEDKIRKKKS